MTASPIQQGAGSVLAGLNAPAIDPLSTPMDGAYSDDLVAVRAVRHTPRPRRELHTVRTTHFDVRTLRGRVYIDHCIPPARIDDDLAGLLSDELFGPGWLRGPDLFERVFTGIVISSDDDPLSAWERFYRNTLDRIEEALAAIDASPDPDGSSGSGNAHGTVADYAPVYRFAESLVLPGSTLELGSCFGFLSLRLAASSPYPVTASDLNQGTCRLLAAMAQRLGVRLTVRAADAARFPAADGHADTVLLVHLLEHLDPDHGERVLREARRLARKRVVVAVPFEDQPDETYGHLRSLSTQDLQAWGEASRWRYTVHTHHGGWLVLDRP